MLTIGRILFAVLFIFSGATKLFDIPATAKDVAAKILPVPAMVATYTTQLAETADMPIENIVAIAVGALELIAGLLIALNFGARFFAIILVFFVLAATFTFHNFWDMTGADRTNNMIHALKNLSLIGGLLMIAGLPRSSRQPDSAYPDV